MKHFLILGAFLTAASLIAPVAATADDHHRDRRYYDREHRDYHYCYLVEQHRVYVPFVSVNMQRRREYFRYRHEHGFRVEVR